ncbi:TVP38/TMEM64 family protein [Haloflavibacter putidus]|uniref:TVP38/TMEM64 family membrane protein n=1 Tax=Haloflavibacter putidus TaxID=2576776 RepID=A0A507ZTJ0_9FLAO|nr:VTT domain-containing protein [Haloflavibacter putidus]TQD39048.1 VTT domain-containing protein [Haloflavibacter putidus]
MKASNIAKYSSLFFTIGLLLILTILYFVLPEFQSSVKELWDALLTGEQERISEVVKGFGAWGVVALILLMVFQMFLVIFPSWLPMIIAALVYGFFPSILISSAGVFLASTIGYSIGHGISESALERFIKEKTFKKLKFWVSNYGFWSVVLFRVSPFLSNDAISILAGGLQMRYLKFITATMLGIIPLATGVAYFAHDIDQLKSGLYWIGGAGILIYAAFVYIDYRKRKKKG